MTKQATQKKLYARHGEATDALAGINPNNKNRIVINEDADKAIFHQEGIEVTVSKYSETQASIGVNVHKLLTFGIIKFTSLFDRQKLGDIYEVHFSIDEYIRITGGDIPADRNKRRRKRNEMQKRLRRELMLLQSIRLTSTNGKDFESINIICRTAVKSGSVTIEFFRPFAEYLLHQPKTIIHPLLLRINARSRTAYAIGLKCVEHYRMNIRRNTSAARKLTIKYILKHSPLPDYESVLRDGRSWTERIRLPFEKALDELVTTGLFLNWQYDRPASSIINYQTFENTMILFEIAPDD